MELVAPRQACYQKQVAEFGVWLCAEGLKYVPQRQGVFSLSKATVPHYETAANLFYDGPQTIVQVKSMRLESIEPILEPNSALRGCGSRCRHRGPSFGNF